MDLQQRIDQDLKVAMKKKDTVKVSVLRLLKSALSYKQIDKDSELTEADIIAAIGKEAKKRRESIAAYLDHRQDLVDREQQELEILESYLPASLSDREINQAIDETISSLGKTQNFGQTMGAVMAKLKGKQVDGKRVKDLVSEKLNG